MTPLESKIAAYLAEAEPLIQLYPAVAQKWVAIDANQSQLQTVEDKGLSFAVSWARVDSKLKTLPSYQTAKEAFERDRTFADAGRRAGYWATFDAVIQSIVLRASSIKRKRVAINHSKALDELRELRRAFGADHLRYEAVARFLGVSTKQRTLKLPDDVILVRLTRKEIADRQPVVHIGFNSEGTEAELLRESTEIRVPVTVPLQRDARGIVVDGAFFAATNAAMQVAAEIFSRILQATLLTFRGAAAIGTLKLSGGVPSMPYGRSMSRSMPFFGTIVIGKRSTSRLSVAYDLVLGGRSSDKTLTRALHRFSLGRNRADLVDKLVDYVIAWEALLLTQEGNALAQEMSYRFSINGAALLSVVRRETERTPYFKKMLSAYRARSAIVHGGTDADRDKALSAGGFQNIGELCTFLEDHFRDSVFWLTDLPTEKRPYRESGGWETLIWAR